MRTAELDCWDLGSWRPDLGIFFFFQAEDGIRDKLVTGVQTCALPISGPPIPGPGSGLVANWFGYLRQDREYARGAGIPLGVYRQTFHALQDYNSRSEERRVGKECRSRWSPYH